MKITKQRLKEIIREELSALRESVEPYDIGREDAANDGEADGKAGEPKAGGYGGFQKFYDRAYAAAAKKKPDDLSEAEGKHDHLAGNKLVSRDGKKKGFKVSGTWKSGKIKVKWVGEEGIHNVERPQYTRKSW